MREWLTRTASEQGRAIGEGALDPVALTEGYLAAIKADPRGTRIYARLMENRALAEAEAARVRAKQGVRRGVLDGVPVSWKDLFDSANVATEASSRLLEGRVPDRDADVLARAAAGGMVALGKTHMSELAFSGLGLNPMFGVGLDPLPATPPNINDPDAVPGGSSSGAAASVAFGLAAAAIGSDTGGSVRVPAAFNDLVGLKTSHGRLSNLGVVPLCAKFDTVGPLARSVEDCAEIFALLAGERTVDLKNATLQGRRFLIIDPYAEDARDAPAQGFARAVEAFQAAGVRISRATSPALDAAMALSPVLFATEAYATWREVIEASPEKMFGPILQRFRGGAEVLASDYIAAWQKLEALREDFHRETAGYDAVIAPTVPILPPNITRLMEDEAYYVTENLLCLRNTRIGNLMGSCGLTLPTGVPSTGVMLLCPAGHEARLLRLGAAAEIALRG
ncbi:amidase family protein [Rhodobacteraceae bacterium XHP0102]|nr:amidase family protein [Rhodobacteraceae bacterium XHP0102]